MRASNEEPIRLPSGTADLLPPPGPSARRLTSRSARGSWWPAGLRVGGWPRHRDGSRSRGRIVADFAIAGLFIGGFVSLAFWGRSSSELERRERLAGQWRMDLGGARMRVEDRDAVRAVREELERDRGLTIDLDRDGALFFRWDEEAPGGSGDSRIPSYRYDVDGEELIFKLGEGREVRYGYAIEAPDRMTLKLRLLGHEVAVPCYRIGG